MCRELIPAVESWELDSVMPIYQRDDKEVKDDIDSLMGSRDSCSTWLPLIKSILGCRVKNELLGNAGLKELQADIEDTCQVIDRYDMIHMIYVIYINYKKYVFYIYYI